MLLPAAEKWAHLTKTSHLFLNIFLRSSPITAKRKKKTMEQKAIGSVGSSNSGGEGKGNNVKDIKPTRIYIYIGKHSHEAVQHLASALKEFAAFKRQSSSSLPIVCDKITSNILSPSIPARCRFILKEVTYVGSYQVHYVFSEIITCLSSPNEKQIGTFVLNYNRIHNATRGSGLEARSVWYYEGNPTIPGQPNTNLCYTATDADRISRSLKGRHKEKKKEYRMKSSISIERARFSE
ncbi:hypothetical protein EK904_015021 [Melospiza melodia maxima]|nr:hypothetical protein EK904_015021 [Melospiza melodia maxima]